MTEKTDGPSEPTDWRSDMLSHLRSHHPTICRQWFAELEPLGVAGGQLQLRARTIFHRDYLRRQCADPFNDAIVSVVAANMRHLPGVMGRIVAALLNEQIAIVAKVLEGYAEEVERAAQLVPASTSRSGT